MGGAAVGEGPVAAAAHRAKLARAALGNGLAGARMIRGAALGPVGEEAELALFALGRSARAAWPRLGCRLALSGDVRGRLLG